MIMEFIGNWLLVSAFLKALEGQVDTMNLWFLGKCVLCGPVLDLSVDLHYALVKVWHLNGSLHLVVSSTDSPAEAHWSTD